MVSLRGRRRFAALDGTCFEVRRCVGAPYLVFFGGCRYRATFAQPGGDADACGAATHTHTHTTTHQCTASSSPVSSPVLAVGLGRPVCGVGGMQVIIHNRKSSSDLLATGKPRLWVCKLAPGMKAGSKSSDLSEFLWQRYRDAVHRACCCAPSCSIRGVPQAPGAKTGAARWVMISDPCSAEEGDQGRAARTERRTA